MRGAYFCRRASRPRADAGQPAAAGAASRCASGAEPRRTGPDLRRTALPRARAEKAAESRSAESEPAGVVRRALPPSARIRE